MKCFIIMPFEGAFRPVYDVVREAVTHGLGETPVECN